MKKQLLDQSLHVLAALAILLPVAFVPSALTFALAGCGIGLVREITEGAPVTNPGSLLDILFWAVGGLAAFHLANL